LSNTEKHKESASFILASKCLSFPKKSLDLAIKNIQLIDNPSSLAIAMYDSARYIRECNNFKNQLQAQLVNIQNFPRTGAEGLVAFTRIQNELITKAEVISRFSGSLDLRVRVDPRVQEKYGQSHFQQICRAIRLELIELRDVNVLDNVHSAQRQKLATAMEDILATLPF
jgi:hypothetical protein